MARISDAEIARELDEIIRIVGHDGDSDGASRSKIEKAYKAAHKHSFPPRTLQRRLERLVAEGRIHAVGASKSTIYRLPTSEEQERTDLGEEGPQSAQAARLRNLVLRPLGKREPVGYDRDWLFDYTPGKSWYLTKSQRAQLNETGRTQGDERLAGTFARDILSRLLIDLAWASSKLEGNTYSRLDTQNLLEFGQRAEGKDAREAQMILNHKTAIEYVVGEADETQIRRVTILSIHAALSENLLDNPRDEGRLRDMPVNITGTSYTPTAIPRVIREAFERMVDTINAIPDPFEQAFFAMVHIPYLQPFVDVNKRTSRLVANLALIRSNLCPLSFVGADEQAYVLGTLTVYEQRRTELLRDFFITAYERSAAQYRVVRDSVVQPDPIRLTYRNELRDTVREIVVMGSAPGSAKIRELTVQAGIPGPDRNRFGEVVLELVLNLNEGSASRYGVRPSQFAEWEQRVRTTTAHAPSRRSE